MKKRLLAILTVAVMLVAGLSVFAGCFDSEETPSFKIGVLHIGSKNDTSGYTYAHQQGINYAQEQLGLSDAQFIYKNNVSDEDEAAIDAAVQDLIIQGCNMIIGTSFGYQDVMQKYAKENPQIIFSHATGSKNTMGEGQNNNMNNYFGRIYQVRYLSGLVAGLNTQTGHIGYVSAFGSTVAETASGINAFTLGAQAAAAIRGKKVTVHVMTLGSWFDLVNEKGYAETLIKTKNCDIVTQHCDTSGPSAAAKEAGVYSIGYNSDMATAVAADGAERDNSVLTSVLWNWGAYYKPAIETAMKCFDADGNFVSTDEWVAFNNSDVNDYYGSFADGLFKLAEFSPECDADTKTVVELVEAMMMKGTEEWDVFKKPLVFSKDADGKITVAVDEDGVILKADETPIGEVSDSVIKATMNYYVAGVIQ